MSPTNNMLMEISSDEEDCNFQQYHNKPKSLRLDDDDDDACVLLDNDPNQPLLHNHHINNSGDPNDDSDDVLVVSEKGQVACRDYPHSRHLCIIFPFSTTPNQTHCNKCYCYVCDSLAPCVYWGNGTATTDHCHATDKDEFWITERKNVKNGSKFAQPVTQPAPPPVRIPNPSLVHAPHTPANFQHPRNNLLTSRSIFNPDSVSQALIRTHKKHNLGSTVHRPVFKRAGAVRVAAPSVVRVAPTVAPTGAVKVAPTGAARVASTGADGVALTVAAARRDAARTARTVAVARRDAARVAPTGEVGVAQTVAAARRDAARAARTVAVARRDAARVASTGAVARRDATRVASTGAVGVAPTGEVGVAQTCAVRVAQTVAAARRDAARAARTVAVAQRDAPRVASTGAVARRDAARVSSTGVVMVAPTSAVGVAPTSAVGVAQTGAVRVARTVATARRDAARVAQIVAAARRDAARVARTVAVARRDAARVARTVAAPRRDEARVARRANQNPTWGSFENVNRAIGSVQPNASVNHQQPQVSNHSNFNLFPGTARYQPTPPLPSIPQPMPPQPSYHAHCKTASDLTRNEAQDLKVCGAGQGSTDNSPLVGGLADHQYSWPFDEPIEPGFGNYSLDSDFMETSPIFDFSAFGS